MLEAKQASIQLVETDLCAYIGDCALPTLQEQADRLIQWISDTQVCPHDRAVTWIERLAAIFGTPADTDRNDEPGLRWLIRELRNKRLFEIKSRSRGRAPRFRLLMEGWQRHEQLSRRIVDSRVALRTWS
jgi:hypothetical protein